LIQHIIVCFLLFGITTMASGQKVIAEVDSAHIMIGDHLNYYLKIKNAAGIENPLADLSSLDTMQAFELIEEKDWQKLAEGDDVYYQKDLTITSFDSGFFYLPSIKVEYTQNNRKIKKGTQRIQLAVITPQIDSLQIRQIKTIVKEPLTIADFIPLIISVVSFILVCLLVYFIYKRISNRPVEEVYIAPKPAHEIALSKLKALSEKQLWQKGQLKEYQSELTYIVREYLEKRYGIQARESTTAEIITELKNEDITEGHKKQLSEMFSMADMVKFAKATPPLDIQSKLLNEAESFVFNTKKEIIAESEKPGEA